MATVEQGYERHGALSREDFRRARNDDLDHDQVIVTRPNEHTVRVKFTVFDTAMAICVPGALSPSPPEGLLDPTNPAPTDVP